MSLEYFRQRDRFDFSKNTLDIGNYLHWNKKSFLKHFFLRIFATDASRWEEFYTRHLNYYLAKHEDGKEEDFFTHLWSLIETRLKTLVEKDIYESKNHVRDQQEIKHLKSLTGFLISIDKWNSHETEVEIIMRQQNQINTMQNKMDKMDKELKTFRLLETKDHINIPKGYVLTLVDIILQIQEQTIDGKIELAFAQTQAIWMKIICKYFTEDRQPIKYERIKRYFTPDPDDLSKSKFSPVPENKKLFKIIPAKKRS
ncbi:hypothetical protein [Pedobacter sp. L105]|uniref:hypothetical protein n=1 Tax=Pedobacter sp. L105 TaxID=1641871 RepID=UPI00131B76D0|nr:hypothetical protein [Pedobacter sp. L105]